MDKVFSGPGEITWTREGEGKVGIMIQAENNAMKVTLDAAQVVKNLRELGLVK